ncbi:MAG: FKBP-type peptidyl-prolyl cis-trans isomerase [Faecalibacterium sp.]|nr:FKBP-type peptidyl-prolyl cis-trans isomerase [Faecalibacterium sp.]
MKRSLLRFAGASLCLAFVLSGCGAASESASSIASSAASSEPAAASSLTASFKASDQYDYINFNYSTNLDTTGMWSGIKASDYVTLPEDYKAIQIPQASVTPSDDDITKGVNTIVAQYAAAAEGDTVNIDYVGSVNGVEFTGGNTQGAGYDLTLGSGKFITGFEDQIVGHKVGETFDVNVTFPDGYQDSTDKDGNKIVLSNAAAVFSVTINSITYGWDLTDDWVAANLGADPYNVTTVDALRAYESDKLLKTNEENYVIDYLVDHATFADTLPEPVVDYMVCKYLAFYNEYAEYYNLDLKAYFAAFDYTSIDAALADHETDILDAVKSSLVQQAVAEAESLAVTDEERESYSTYVDNYGDAYVAQFALDRQVRAWLLANATVA